MSASADTVSSSADIAADEMMRWVGLGVLADNLINIGRTSCAESSSPSLAGRMAFSTPNTRAHGGQRGGLGSGRDDMAVQRSSACDASNVIVVLSDNVIVVEPPAVVASDRRPHRTTTLGHPTTH